MVENATEIKRGIMINVSVSTIMFVKKIIFGIAVHGLVKILNI